MYKKIYSCYQGFMHAVIVDHGLTNLPFCMRLCKQSYEKHLFYIKNGNGYFFFRYADKDSGRSLADFKINIVELSKYSPIYTHLCWII